MEENQNVLNHINAGTEPKKEEKVEFSRLECIYAYLMLAAGFCFIRFAVWNAAGLFTTVFFIVFAFVSLFYLKKHDYKLYRFHKITFGLILVFSLVFSITANFFIKF